MGMCRNDYYLPYRYKVECPIVVPDANNDSHARLDQRLIRMKSSSSRGIYTTMQT